MKNKVRAMTKYEKLIERLERELPHVSPDQLKNWISAGNVLLVDVRERAEYEQGHIPGSINLPRGKLEAQVESYLSSADQSIVVYCGSRGRSHLVGMTLKEMGLDIHVLSDGFKNWSDTTAN